MGIAAADYSGDGREDLFVTNSRDQLHAVFRSATGAAPFADARPDFAPALGTSFTGWGVSWADLDLDGDLDLVLANGAIPVTNLGPDAQRMQVLENSRAKGSAASSPTPGRSPASPEPARQRARPRRRRLRQRRRPRRRGRLRRRAGSLLLQNSGATGHWLEVSCPVRAGGDA